MIYTEKELPQKSEEWLKFRLDKIGTSEISIIRGKFPKIWCDDYELFLRKMGKPYDNSSSYTDIGNRDEDKARVFIEEYLNYGTNSEHVYDRTGGMDVKDAKFVQCTVQYKHNPSIFSSFDGIDVNNKLTLEIKCPSEKTFAKILKNRQPVVSRTYVDQVQGQLMIANSHFDVTQGIFAPYLDEGVEFFDKELRTTRLIKLILVKTELDVEYCKEIEEDCRKYLQMIVNRQWRKNWNEG